MFGIDTTRLGVRLHFRKCLLAVSLISITVFSTHPVVSANFTPADLALAAKALDAFDKKKLKTVRANIALIHDPVIRRALNWVLYVDHPASASWQEIAGFVDQNRNWPKLGTLRRYAEERMSLDDSLPDAVAWFQDWPPVTARGQALLADHLLDIGRTDEALTMLRKAWVEGDFNRRDEGWFYKSYRRYLSREDNEARLERLLWKGANWPVRRMFFRVNEDLRKLAEARYLLRHMSGNVDTAIAAVPAMLNNHPGLVYERLRWRRKKNKNTAARELLDGLRGSSVPHAALWYTERDILARRALHKGLFSVAYDLVSNHGIDQSDAAPFSSAEWLSGWIALRFLGEAERAYNHFTAMYAVVRFPISRARGAYWAGRAADDRGDGLLAKGWYEKAALYPTTYYGQLARTHLGLNTPLVPATTSHALNPVGEDFDNHVLVQAIHLFDQLDAPERMRPFFLRLRDLKRENMPWLIAIGNLALEVNREDMAIAVAKTAVNQNTFLPDLGYPVLNLPAPPERAIGPAAETALVHALIRQESAFFAAARSHAGARGLMQIMPATAKVTARSVKMPYERARLTRDIDYNLQLGQAYLAEVLDQFDGSYILGLSAYNAGPHRAKAWIRANGDPRDPDVDAVDWVEMIPFSETRDYVQRVLENLQVYRAILYSPELAQSIRDDLTR